MILIFGGITFTEVDGAVPVRGETAAVAAGDAGVAADLSLSEVSCRRMREGVVTKVVRHRRWHDGCNDGRHGR